MEFENPYIVYVKPDSNGYITAVNSSGFLADITGWVEVDSGYGDRFRHAQSNYFPKPVFTENSACRYKLAEGRPMECTPQEIAQQEECSRQNAIVFPSLERRVETLEADNSELKEALGMILAGVTE